MSHNVADIEDAAHLHIERQSELTSELTKKLAECNGHIHVASQLQAVLENNAIEVGHQIETLTTTLHNQIEAQKQRLLHKIHTTRQQNVMALQRHLSNLGSFQKNLLYVYRKHCDSFDNHNTNSEILNFGVELKNILEYDTKFDYETNVITLKPATFEGGPSNLIGSLHIQNSPLLSSDTNESHLSRSFPRSYLEIGLNKSKKKSSVELPLSMSLSSSFRRHSLFKRNVCLKPIFQFDIYDSLQLTCLLLYDKHQIFLTGRKGDIGIMQIYEKQGKYLKTILDSGDAFQMAGNRKNSKIFITEPDKRILTKMRSKDFNVKTLVTNKRVLGVTVNSEADVIFSDAETRCIYKCSNNGQNIKLLIKSEGINHSFKKPVYLTTDTMDNIYITDIETNHVICFRQNAEMLFKYGGPKHLNKPGQVCIDKDGFVLVADENNDRIVLLDDQGKFVKVLLDSKNDLCKPVCLALDFIKQPRLFVGESCGVVKVFKYLTNEDKENQ
ncbi:unnamed protein product [Dimorphilus gyrociliatus]|nr:unnamed protein product [Dimorphilus gyrociliatus]